MSLDLVFSVLSVANREEAHDAGDKVITAIALFQACD